MHGHMNVKFLQDLLYLPNYINIYHCENLGVITHGWFEYSHISMYFVSAVNG